MVAAVGEEPSTESGRRSLIERLDPDQRRSLAYASAIGREFDFPLLVAAMGVNDESLAEQVERLVHLGFLKERPGGDRFGFADEETRARIYQTLTASRLRVLHRKIAEAMERRHAQPTPEDLPELGRHFFLGRVPEKSYDYNRRAATLAREADAPEQAAHHLERARIDLHSLGGPHAAEEAILAQELGDLYYSMGDVRAADRLYAEALELVSESNPALRARLLLSRAEVARDNLDVAVAVASAHEARQLFRASGDSAGLASVHRVLGRIAYHHGAYRESLDESMEALYLLEGQDDPRVMGRLCIDIGNAFSMLGPDVRDETTEWYHRAIDRLVHAGDWAEVARAYLNLGVAAGETAPDEGLEHLARSREFAEKGHEPRWVGWALVMGIEMRLAVGQVEEAERDNQQATRLLERLDDPLGLQQATMNAGLINERRGQWEEAETAYRQAVERAERLSLGPEVAECEFHLARLHYKTRDIPRAREAFRRSKERNLPALKPVYAAAFAELGRQLESSADAPSPPS